MNPIQRGKRREQVSLNLVPVMDMLTAIIFFLLLSTTFIEFTKLPVPPSGVKTISDPVAPPPLAPQLFIELTGVDEIGASLVWSGSEPGREFEKIPYEKYSPENHYPQKLQEKLNELIKKFSNKYPKEKTIQIGFGEKIPYRSMIAVMDAVLPYIPDVVLVSYVNVRLLSRNME